MKVSGIRTRAVLPEDRGLLQFLDANIKRLQEGSIVAITSKVAAILEGAVVKKGTIDKKELIAQEADLWAAPDPRSKYRITLTVKNGILAATAGIDESNGDGYYVLWPKDPQRTANAARRHLMKRFGLRRLGVVLTDSSSRPLRRGTFGVAIAHSGFRALHDYIGTPDIFGRKLKITRANLSESLAAAAVAVMGEGAERIPLAVIEDLPFVEFQKKDPDKKELKLLAVGMQEDLYAPILRGARWRNGKKG